MSDRGVVYVTAKIDPAKTVLATRDCGCPVYREDLPIHEWLCEHGNSWSSAS